MRSAGTLIRYDGEVLGFVTATRVRYTAALDRRGALEPLRARWLKRFVFAMGLYAIDVARGDLPAPYRDDRAQYFARTFLIDDDAFRSCEHLDDVVLADRFGVPVPQVALKRDDLARQDGDLEEQEAAAVPLASSWAPAEPTGPGV